MIEKQLSFSLPLPWTNQAFETDRIGAINFLVGPNGTGKSRFALQLFNQLGGKGGPVRLLGTDRLSEMAWPGSLGNYWGDQLATGFAKNHFNAFRTAGTEGSGIDTIVLLEERVDLRIQIEATLSHLFDREITLEWDSGNLLPKAELRGSGQSYRLDREECHGIKELLVLLTHLYDDKKQYLIIDEPELNLHPQYQAFFMQEVRRVAGDPATNGKKKVVFLVTHSPFILDLRSEDDLKSVISFDLKYSVPKQVSKLDFHTAPPAHFTRRLNAHHKQLFFSDNPIFVEGIHDAWLVEAMMEARGVSVAGAGSCIIDAGGAEEVNHYLELCQGLGKTAHFLYDLDSLFRGNLRACIKDDESVQGFLLSSGLGNDFGKYCGQMEKGLSCLIDQLLCASLPPHLSPLEVFLRNVGDRSQWKQEQWAKARIAVMTAISRYRDDVVSVVTEPSVTDIEGRRDQILNALKGKNIHVLPGGTLERYLPHYTGDEYELNPDAKREAVYAEMEEITNLANEEALADRYSDLYIAVSILPSKAAVDVDVVLRNHLSNYIHDLQRTVVNNPDWEIDHIRQRLDALQPSQNGVFAIRQFERKPEGGFNATIGIIEMLGQRERIVQVNGDTNAGMGDFQIELAQTVSAGAP